MEQNVKPFRVLTLDGGGIRGLYTASLLHQLSIRFARFQNNPTESKLDLGSQFDLIVGTSTGAIIAVALAAGIPLEDIIKLYRTKSKDIFQFSMPLQNGCLLTVVKTWLWVFRNTLSPANNSMGLQALLTDVLKEETLEQVYQRRNCALCIPTIDAETQKGWVFKTPHSQRLTRDNHYKLVDVCMASAAAPIYFPLHNIESPNGSTKVSHKFVDGGLWANNPILIGLVEALEIAEPSQQIQILSVGTGTDAFSQATSLNSKSLKRGGLKWKMGVDIIDMSIKAQASTTTYYASKLAEATGRVTLHRLKDFPVSANESPRLSLDAVDSQSLELLETMAHRAADSNFSALTNTNQSSKEIEMVLNMFSDIKQVKES